MPRAHWSPLAWQSEEKYDQNAKNDDNRHIFGFIFLIYATSWHVMRFISPIFVFIRFRQSMFLYFGVEACSTNTSIWEAQKCRRVFHVCHGFCIAQLREGKMVRTHAYAKKNDKNHNNNDNGDGTLAYTETDTITFFIFIALPSITFSSLTWLIASNILIRHALIHWYWSFFSCFDFYIVYTMSSG